LAGSWHALGSSRERRVARRAPRLRAAAGIPERGFDNDHYDYPLRRRNELIALGATPVSGRELLRRLQAAGLRVRQKDKH
jgi:hypothetical protein